MSQEQANTYRKFRTADDIPGNLGWAAKMTKRAFRVAPEASAEGIEREFEFTKAEKVLWRLMKIARKYTDLETAGLLPVEEVRGFMRGLVSADVLDIVEAEEAKALIPLEIKRVKAQVAGKSAPKKSSAGRVKGRVYRPDISGSKPKEEAPQEVAAATSAPEEKPAAAAPLSDDQKATKALLEAAYTAMKAQDHYAFLGVAPKADAGAIKKAYVSKARELHPDQLAGTPLADDEKLVAKTDALFKRLQEANHILTDDAQRAAYDKQLSASGHTDSRGKVLRSQEAQIAYQKAEVLYKRGDYKTAERHYKIAHEFDWENPTIQLGLAWCHYINPNNPEVERTDNAKLKLCELVEKSKLADAAYKLGIIARKEGIEADAVDWFRKAVKLNPRHKDAAAEVQLAKRRAEKAAAAAQEAEREEKGGLMGRLFKR